MRRVQGVCFAGAQLVLLDSEFFGFASSADGGQARNHQYREVCLSLPGQKSFFSFSRIVSLLACAVSGYSCRSCR
jgi:hypothetical protein